MIKVVRIMGAALAFGLFFWVLHAAISVIFYQDLVRNVVLENPDTFWDALLFKVPPHTLFVRFFVLATALVGGVLVTMYVIRSSRADAARRASDERLRLALDAVNDGVWDWHIPSDAVYYSEQYARLLGFAPGELPHKFQTWDQFIHPDDYTQVHSVLDAYLAGQTSDYQIEHRLRTKAGAYLWVLARGEVIERDENGAPLRMIGTLTDISAQKSVEIMLERHTKRLGVLHEIDRHILNSETAEEIAQNAVTMLLGMVEAETANVAAFDFAEKIGIILGVAAPVPIAAKLPRQTFPLEGIRAVYFESFRRGEVVIEEDLSARTDPAPIEKALLAAGQLAFCTVPMLVGGRLIGTVLLSKSETTPFDPNDIEVAEEVAAQIGVGIQQVRLRQAIEHHTEVLEQRVEERTAELAAANEELKAATRVKDEFVSNVSHELRTPISSLKLRHYLLEKLLPSTAAGHMDVVKRETHRLERIIENLLNLSRMDQGRVEFKPAPLDVNTVVEQYAADRAPVADEHGLALMYAPAADLPPAIADGGLIGQVLSILLTNAINYTPPGGHVEIRTLKLHEDGTQWVGFSVADNGPGIPPAEQQRLFERFFRGEDARASGTPGTGLGLALVHEIIVRHNGRVDVESSGIPGEGVTFTVLLPAHAPGAN